MDRTVNIETFEAAYRKAVGEHEKTHEGKTNKEAIDEKIAELRLLFVKR